jgi:hypothetical protein
MEAYTSERRLKKIKEAVSNVKKLGGIINSAQFFNCSNLWLKAF